MAQSRGPFVYCLTKPNKLHLESNTTHRQHLFLRPVKLYHHRKKKHLCRTPLLATIHMGELYSLFISSESSHFTSADEKKPQAPSPSPPVNQTKDTSGDLLLLRRTSLFLHVTNFGETPSTLISATSTEKASSTSSTEILLLLGKHITPPSHCSVFSSDQFSHRQ